MRAFIEVKRGASICGVARLAERVPRFNANPWHHFMSVALARFAQGRLGCRAIGPMKGTLLWLEAPVLLRTTGDLCVSKRTRISTGLQIRAATQWEYCGDNVSSLVADPEVRGRAETTLGDTERDWLCAFCYRHVANENDRFPFNGKDEFTCVNPEGMKFEIITFSQTHGCREMGKPTLADTWIPGYGWSFCHCDGCGQQLGWYYAGLLRFVGLDKARIVRALVNN